MKQSSNSEGLIVSGGIILILISVAGGLATGIGPVEFLFVGTGILAITAMAGGGLLVGGIAVYKALADSRLRDGRSFWQRLRQNYNWAMIRSDIQMLMAHLRVALQEKNARGPDQD